MTDNYFMFAILMLLLAITDIVRGWLLPLLAVAGFVLALLSGYGVLPQWQG